MTSVHDCRVIDLPSQGGTSCVEGTSTVPFEIARVYYLRDEHGGASRGGHAHRRLEQLMVAAAGSFRVVLDDGSERREVELGQPHRGLFTPCLIWREVLAFSPGAVCLVLASAPYDEADYIRGREDFVAVKRSLAGSGG